MNGKIRITTTTLIGAKRQWRSVTILAAWGSIFFGAATLVIETLAGEPINNLAFFMILFGMITWRGRCRARIKIK